jgi:hypothetical protein
MEIVMLLCLIIFITYLCICFILAYYFLQHRNIWNKIFNYLNFSFLYIENIECPIHNILANPVPELANKVLPWDSGDSGYGEDGKANCTLCKKEIEDKQIYAKEIEMLSCIYKLFKEIDKTCIYENANAYAYANANAYTMYLWLMEGSIKDYETIKNERATVYYKLKDTFAKLNENHSSITNNIPLENISYLENNIEIYKKIIDMNNIYKKNIIDIKSHYLFALFNDIDDYVKQCNVISNVISNVML